MYKSISEIGAPENKNRDQYSVLELVNQEQKNQILRTHKVVLVDVFANWCGPCKTIAPSYALLAMKYSKPTICAVVKQQYDSVEDEIKDKIQGIPLFLYFENGQLVNTVVGADLEQVEKELIKLLERAVNTDNSRHDPPPQYKSNIRNSRGTAPGLDQNESDRFNRVQANPHNQPSLFNHGMNPNPVPPAAATSKSQPPNYSVRYN